MTETLTYPCNPERTGGVSEARHNPSFVKFVEGDEWVLVSLVNILTSARPSEKRPTVRPLLRDELARSLCVGKSICESVNDARIFSILAVMYD